MIIGGRMGKYRSHHWCKLKKSRGKFSLHPGQWSSRKTQILRIVSYDYIDLGKLGGAISHCKLISRDCSWLKAGKGGSSSSMCHHLWKWWYPNNDTHPWHGTAFTVHVMFAGDHSCLRAGGHWARVKLEWRVTKVLTNGILTGPLPIFGPHHRRRPYLPMFFKNLSFANNW